ncbi:MAG: hypothetical protein J0G32_05735 [Alphaproteobacteria bacterium]|nr:hypothetical protein [Alphaproteobacteria bacterium]OJV17122.1 MAG: hypothetical protein BGO27_06045 [Alphaproteobacteria bacterium 33-17]
MAKYLVITRPLIDFEETAKILHLSDYLPFSLPLSTVNHLNFELHKPYTNYIVTSKNAIKSLKNSNQLIQGNIIGLNGDYLEFPDVNIIKTGDNAESLVNFLEDNPAYLENSIYLRGDNITFNITEHFDNKIDEIIVYNTDYLDHLSEKQINILQTNPVITIFSVKAAETFIKLTESIKFNPIICCLSKKIAEYFPEKFSKNLYFSDTSNINSFKQKLDEVIRCIK